MKDPVFADVTTKVLNTRPFSPEFKKAMSTLKERIKEIESEKARMRQMLRERIEAAIEDYLNEVDDEIRDINVTGAGVVHVLYKGEEDYV